MGIPDILGMLLRWSQLRDREAGAVAWQLVDEAAAETGGASSPSSEVWGQEGGELSGRTGGEVPALEEGPGRDGGASGRWVKEQTRRTVPREANRAPANQTRAAEWGGGLAMRDRPSLPAHGAEKQRPAIEAAEATPMSGARHSSGKR